MGVVHQRVFGAADVDIGQRDPHRRLELVEVEDGFLQVGVNGEVAALQPRGAHAGQLLQNAAEGGGNPLAVVAQVDQAAGIVVDDVLPDVVDAGGVGPAGVAHQQHPDEGAVVIALRPGGVLGQTALPLVEGQFRFGVRLGVAHGLEALFAGQGDGVEGEVGVDLLLQPHHVLPGRVGRPARAEVVIDTGDAVGDEDDGPFARLFAVVQRRGVVEHGPGPGKGVGRVGLAQGGGAHGGLQVVAPAIGHVRFGGVERADLRQRQVDLGRGAIGDDADAVDDTGAGVEGDVGHQVDGRLDGVFALFGRVVAAGVAHRGRLIDEKDNVDRRAGLIVGLPGGGDNGRQGQQQAQE